MPASTTTCVYGAKTLQTGQTLSGYLKNVVPAGQTCDPITITCNGGVLDGLPAEANFASTLFQSCEVGGCSFNNQIVGNHQTVPAYSAPLVGHSQSCTSVQTNLTCTDGTLGTASGAAGSGYSPVCAVAASSSCSFTNWISGLTTVKLQSGQTATGFSSNSVLEGNSCSSVQENLACSDGVLSLNGTPQSADLGIFYFYDSCNVGLCTISGQTVIDGATISAYSTGYVAHNVSCSTVQETLTCKNSRLYSANGAVSNYVTSCSQAPTEDCNVTNWARGLTNLVIKNGQTLTGYSLASANSVESCANSQLTLLCSEGLISINGGPFEAPKALGIFNYYPNCQ